MNRRHLAATMALAAMARAQTIDIQVSESSTQSDPIEVSPRPTSDVPNMSESTTSTTPIDTSTIPTVITLPVPTVIPISSISNHINGNNTYSATASGSCATVTKQGEPMFTIQTDTRLESPCTYTVFASTSGTFEGPASISTTKSSSDGEIGDTTAVSGTASTTSAPGGSSAASTTATQSDNPANRVGMGAEGLGLAAFVAALGLL